MSYHDEPCSVIRDDGHTVIKGLPLRGVPLTDATVRSLDLVIIVVDPPNGGAPGRRSEDGLGGRPRRDDDFERRPRRRLGDR